MKIINLIDQLPVHSEKRYKTREVGEIKTVAIHHSLTKDIPGSGDIFAFARYHVNDLGWPGIGYTYVIDTDGTIYKCNNTATVSYHVGKHNRSSLGICLVGDFRSKSPSIEQLEALYELAGVIMEAYSQITPTHFVGHNEYEGYGWKQCPAIDMNYLRKEIRKRVQR